MIDIPVFYNNDAEGYEEGDSIEKDWSFYRIFVPATFSRKNINSWYVFTWEDGTFEKIQSAPMSLSEFYSPPIEFWQKFIMSFFDWSNK